MGTKSVREIVEAAVAAHLSAQTELAGTNVYKGLDTAVDLLPQVIASCESAVPPPDLPEGLGNYECTLQVGVYTSADETNAVTNHRARSAAVLGALQDLAALKTVFTSQGDATLYDITYQSADDSRGDRALGTLASFSLCIVLPA